MDNSKYLLSICIPTYNREACLKRLLDSIVTQEWFTDEISIIIADWPSTDNTESMVSDYIEKHKNIIYHRNPINIGMTRALLEVIWYSQGEYTWMMWSDDQLSHFALKQILSAIKNEHPKLLLSNLFPYKDPTEIKNCNYKDTYITLDWFKKMATYMWTDSYDKNKFWYEQHFTFMSVFCFETQFFKQSLIKAIGSKGKEYIESNYFNYIYIIYSSLWENKIVLFDADFILLHMDNSTMWRPNIKIYNDLEDLFSMINLTYSIDSNFLEFEKKISNYIYKAMYQWQKLVPIISFLEKIWLYKTLSHLWRKYVLKTI